MRKILNATLILIILPILAFAVPRAWGKVGTATNSNATLTCPFNPHTLTVCNNEASGGTAFFIDFTDGVAATTDNSTNIKIDAATCQSWTFLDQNISNTFTIGIITAASTAAYNINAVH